MLITFIKGLGRPHPCPHMIFHLRGRDGWRHQHNYDVGFGRDFKIHVVGGGVFTNPFFWHLICLQGGISGIRWSPIIVLWFEEPWAWGETSDMTGLCKWVVLLAYYIFILILFLVLGTSIFYVRSVRRGKGLLMVWKVSMTVYNGTLVHIMLVSVFCGTLLSHMGLFHMFLFFINLYTTCGLYGFGGKLIWSTLQKGRERAVVPSRVCGLGDSIWANERRGTIVNFFVEVFHIIP